MGKNEKHQRRTAQVWRAGGMIWLVSITAAFSVYDLYFLNLSLLLTISFAVIIGALTFILFAWSLQNLRLAKQLPEENLIDEVKRRKLRRGFFGVLIVEVAAFNIAPFVLLYFSHIKYIVPVEILICAIHFLPLARIFAMPVYYWLGGIVSVITIAVVVFVPASRQLGNLAVIAAVPSLCFIVANWLTITYVLHDTKQYLKTA